MDGKEIARLTVSIVVAGLQNGTLKIGMEEVCTFYEKVYDKIKTKDEATIKQSHDEVCRQLQDESYDVGQY